MPIFEYSCLSCGNRFEALVRAGRPEPRCPRCARGELERLLSAPQVQSSTTRALALKAARARDAREGAERIRVQREYELQHDD